MGGDGRSHICVIGPGTHFLSGITYYTYGLCRALHQRTQVSAILMRGLLPTRFYPGRVRVGSSLTNLRLDPGIAAVDGVDWCWGPNFLRAIRHIVRTRPSAVVFQWWTGAVLHTYLVLAMVARLVGAKIVIEFHEVLDTGEARMPWVGRYVRLVAPRLFGLASAYVVHTEYDRELIQNAYRLRGRPLEVIPLTVDAHPDGERIREAPEGCCNFFYFGVIRPYKGLEDLVRAFEAIPPTDIDRYWLTVVGETWEGWTLPAELIERSPYRDRMTFVNRYVADTEVDGFFRGADVAVFPYHRSSQSGPLHVAFHYGLPIVVTRVGGLVEAVKGYEGALLTEPRNPTMLRDKLYEAAAARSRRFSGGPTWSEAARRYAELLSRIKEQPARAVVAGASGSRGAERQT